MYANASVEITMEEKHNDLTEIIAHLSPDKWLHTIQSAYTAEYSSLCLYSCQD